MRDILCGVCHRPIADQATLCHPCTGDLARRLRQAPELLDELATTAARLGRSSGTGSTSDDNSPMPDLRAAEIGAVLRATIHGWARVLAEESGLNPCGHSSCAQGHRPVCATQGRWLTSGYKQPLPWLLEHLSSLRLREWADVAAGEIRRASIRGWAAIDRPEQRWYAGPCGAELEHPDGTVLCGHTLWANLDQAQLTCPGCRTRWDVVQRREWLLAAADDIVETGSVIASALTLMTRRRVSPTTLRVWVHRGQLASVGERGGARLYRVGDVLAAMQRDQEASV